MTKPALPSHILETAKDRAALRGVPLEDWLAEAVDNLRQRDEAHCARVERTPGPWPGWSSYSDGAGGHICHKSPDGEEIIRMPLSSLDRRLRATEKRRPWIARNREGPIRSKSGACRTFATAEAAKAALDQHGANLLRGISSSP